MTVDEIRQKAESLKQETANEAITPERLGGILTDTLELFDSSFVNRMDIENLLNNLN
jgi:hypothetical protein